MTKWAKLPNGTWLKFADETPPEVVERTYREQMEAQSGGAPRTLPEGATSSNEDVRGESGVPGGTTKEPPPPPTTAEYIWDIVKSLPSDAAKLVTETAMTPVSIGRMGSLDAPSEDLPWYRKTMPQLLGYEEYAKPAREALVKGEDAVRSTIKENLPQPEYAPGKVVEEGVQWIGPAAWPSKATRLATGAPRLFNYAGDILAHGAVPWGAYEGAENYIAPGTGVPAALASALAMGAGKTARSPAAVVRRETAGVTEEQFAEATRLQEYAKTKGIDLSAAEAIAEITNQPNHPLLKSLRLGEAHPSGAAVTGEFFKPRAEQIDAAVKNTLDDIAAAPVAPQNIGPKVSESAQKVIDERQRQINQSTGELYRKSETDLIAPQDYAPLATDPSYAAALKRLREHPELGPRYANDADNSIKVIDAVTKDLFATGEAVGLVNNPQYGPLLSKVRTETAKTARDTARDASSNYATALEEQHAQRQGPQLDLTSGPVGDFAKSTTTDDIIRTMFPAAPTSAMTSALAEGIGQIRATGQEMLPAAREALERIKSTVSGGTLGGDRSRVGAKFAQVLSGSPEKQELLNSVLAASGAPIPATKNFGDLLEVLRATGKRLTEGSPTAQLNAQMGDLSSLPALDAAEAIATQSAGPLFKGALKDYVLRGNIQDLAALTTGPVRNVQAAGAQAWKNLVPDVLKSTGLSTLFASGKDQR